MLKSAARDACAWLLHASGLSAWRRRQPGELLILTFHRVLPADLRRLYPLPGLAVTPEELRWILVTLLPWFESGAVSEQVRRQQSGGAKRPLLAVSFDDGQWDNVGYAAPVLQEVGVRATFYLPTDFIGGTRLLWHDRAAWAWTHAGLESGQRSALLERLGSRDSPGLSPFIAALKRAAPDLRTRTLEELEARVPAVAPEWARMMSWSEAAALHEAGHEIGSHACSHELLPQLDTSTQRRELSGSRSAIAAAIATAPASLCYPNGDFDGRSVDLAAETGYENAVTTRWGINKPAQHRMRLLRCDMDARRLVDRRGRLSAARMAMRMSGLQPGVGR